MSEWRPIETAPEDAAVLLYEAKEGRIGIGGWMRRSDGVMWQFERAGRHEVHCMWHFTHWMPLPDPPD